MSATAIDRLIHHLIMLINHPCPSYSVAFFPLHIGDHVFIGENAIVSATSVGSYVHIGKDVVIVRKQKPIL